MITPTYCTWKDCLEAAEFKQIATDGEVWAVLCKKHNARFDADTTGLRPYALFADWIKAQGGKHIALDRMMKQIVGE